MKKAIRYGVFETNSSSVHSLTMCSEEDFNKWKSGEYLFDTYEEKFVPAFKPSKKEIEAAKDEYIRTKTEYMKDWEDLSETTRKKYILEYAEKNDLFNYDDLKTYDTYFHSYDFETYSGKYTTNKGEVVIAFGKYGYDG